jgi:hypothetical protein
LDWHIANPIDIENLFNKIYEQNALDDGWDLETYRYDEKVRESLRSLADETQGKAPEEWPKFEINWARKPESFCYAIDCTGPQKFASYNPVVLLGWVACEEFHNILHHYNKRASHELWELGSPSKLAKVIAHASQGFPLTPVMVKPHPSSKEEIFLEGGNHRYAMINAMGLISMPILANLQHKESLSRLLNISWA